MKLKIKWQLLRGGIKYIALTIAAIFAAILILATTSMPLPLIGEYIGPYTQRFVPQLQVKVGRVSLAWDLRHYSIALRLQNITWSYNFSPDMKIQEVRLNPLWLGFVSHNHAAIGIEFSSIDELPSAPMLTKIATTNYNEQQKLTYSIVRTAIQKMYEEHFSLLRRIALELPTQPLPWMWGRQEDNNTTYSQLQAVRIGFGGTLEQPELLVSGNLTLHGHISQTARAKIIVAVEPQALSVDAHMTKIPLNLGKILIPDLESSDLLRLNIAAQVHDFEHMPDISFSLSGNNINLTTPQNLPRPIHLKDIYLQGVIRGKEQAVTIPYISVTSKHLALVGDAQLTPSRLQIQTILKHPLELGLLMLYWPPHAASEARHWAQQHVKGGTINDAEINMQLPLKDYVLQPEQLQDEDINVKMTIQNTNLQYLPYAPSVTDIEVHLDIGADSMRIEVPQAQLINSHVKAKCEIEKFSDPITMMHLQASVRGSVQDALTLGLVHIFEDKPIDQATTEVLQPLRSVTGKATTQLGLTLRIQQDVDFSPHVDIESELTEVHAKDIGGHEITSPSLGVTFRNHILSIRGNVVIDGQIRGKVLYDGGFSQKEQTLAFMLPLSTSQMHSLGWDTGKILQGTVLANLVFSSNDFATALNLTMNMSGAEITVPYLGINKKKGQAAELALQFKEYKQGEAMDGTYNLYMPGLSSNGTMQFDKTGALQAITKGQTQLHHSKFVMDMSKNHGYNIHLSGDSLDLSGFSASKVQDTADDMAHNVRIKSKLGKIILHNGQELYKPIFTLGCGQKGCEHVELSGLLDNKHKFELKLNPKSVHLQSEDAGQALAALGVTQNMRYGQLLLDGKWNNLTQTFQGKLNISDYYMRKAPLLAKLLTISSITSTAFAGLGDLLENKGIHFKSLQCGLQYTGGIIQVSNCITRGPVLSMTGDGTIDLGSRNISLHGVIVPENIINSLVKSIPLFGSAISGGKNSGVIATNYVILGNIDDDLNVQVNPLSVLTLGFFKQIVGF